VDHCTSATGSEPAEYASESVEGLPTDTVDGDAVALRDWPKQQTERTRKARTVFMETILAVPCESLVQSTDTWTLPFWRLGI
jgi:hypothetical protein